MIPPEHMTQRENLEDKSDEYTLNALLSTGISLLAFTASEVTRNEPALDGVFTIIWLLFELRGLSQFNKMWEVEERIDSLGDIDQTTRREPLN